MMRLAEPSADGAYKTDDNVIAERMPDGRRVVRFQPTSAADTPEAMRQLVLAYVEARDDAAVTPSARSAPRGSSSGAIGEILFIGRTSFQMELQF
jgi:hypothetical protein